MLRTAEDVGLIGNNRDGLDDPIVLPPDPVPQPNFLNMDFEMFKLRNQKKISQEEYNGWMAATQVFKGENKLKPWKL